MSNIETILLATDLTDASAAATEQAIELAVRLEAGLLVLYVFQPWGIAGIGRARPVEDRELRATGAQAVVQLARAAGAQATFLLWDGDPGDSIIAAAESEAVDMIVVGSRGRSTVGRFVLGSVSDHVVHRAQCPVLVVRPRESDVS
jgi:nucleotide-binding universal stress UspA family protein